MSGEEQVETEEQPHSISPMVPTTSQLCPATASRVIRELYSSSPSFWFLTLTCLSLLLLPFFYTLPSISYLVEKKHRMSLIL